MRAGARAEWVFLQGGMALKLLTALLVVFGGTAIADSAYYSAGGIQRALLIGNSQYRSAKWLDLATAAGDAKALADLLIRHYGFKAEHVLLLQDATKPRILKGFYQLELVSGPEDSLLVYYAGHGEADAAGISWWIPSGAEANYDYLSAQEIKVRLQLIRARHKLLIVDSCFSRSFFEQPSTTAIRSDYRQNSEAVPPDWENKARRRSVQGISSGGNQPVSDGGPKWGGHSIFAYHLLAQLQSNREPLLAASQLAAAVATYVGRDTRLLNQPQVPDFFQLAELEDQGGEFIFRRLSETGKPESLAIAFLETANPQFERFGDPARALLFTELVDILQRNGFRVLPDPLRIPVVGAEAALQERLRQTGQTQALLVSLVVTLEANQTRIWSALGTVEATTWLFQLGADGLQAGDLFKVKAQKLPIDHWADHERYQNEQYISLMNKLVRSFREPDFAAYLRKGSAP